MRFYPLSIIIACGLLDPSRTLQIFNGTLTEITCISSAAMAVYRLVDQEREVYDLYAELPDLFDIEARPSPTGNNVTLYINGTNRSNNVTVMCGNLDLSEGISNQQFNIIFTLILEFVGILPAPNDVHYIEDPPGYLQIHWEPPTLDPNELDLQNITGSIRRDTRITRYTIYITTEESATVQVYNASGTSVAIGFDKIPCSFWFQVAAVNPAGVGERSHHQNLTFDSRTGCMDSTSSTTDMIIEPIPVSSGLSAGEIAAVAVGIVLIITGLLVILAIAFTLKLRNDRYQRVIQSLKSEIKNDQLSGTNDPLAEVDKCVEPDHCSSGNDPDTVDKKQQPDSTLTRTYSQDGPPVCSYLYAEIDVVAKRKNKAPEPSSPEDDISCHEYAVLEKPSNQITDTDQGNDDDNPNSQD